MYFSCNICIPWNSRSHPNELCLIPEGPPTSDMILCCTSERDLKIWFQISCSVDCRIQINEKSTWQSHPCFMTIDHFDRKQVGHETLHWGYRNPKRAISFRHLRGQMLTAPPLKSVSFQFLFFFCGIKSELSITPRTKIFFA